MYKFGNLPEIKYFHRRIEIWVEILTKTQHFGPISIFELNIEILVGNRNFDRKSKVEILIENRNFDRKSKF